MANTGVSYPPTLPSSTEPVALQSGTTPDNSPNNNGRSLQQAISILQEGTNRFADRMQKGFHKAGSALVSGLKSCDDMTMADDKTEIKVADTMGREQFVPRLGDASDPQRVVSMSSDGYESSLEVWGNHKFQFTLTLEGVSTAKNRDKSSIGGRSSEICSGYLKARGTIKRPGKGDLDVPLRCVWRREVGQLSLPVREQNRDRMYILSPDDVGCSIVVEACSVRAPEDGTAYARIGPFSIDSGLRLNIEGYLACGGTRFAVELVQSPDETFVDSSEKQMAVIVSETNIRLVKPGPNNIGFAEEWVALVSPIYDIVSTTLGHPTEFTFHPSPRGDPVRSSEQAMPIKLSASSSRLRDLIVLTVRCFQAKQYVKSSVLMEQVALNTIARKSKALRQAGANISASDSEESETTVDFFLIIEQLTREVSEYINLVKKSNSERSRAVAERDALEADMDSTIQFYQKLLQTQLDNTSSNQIQVSKTSMTEMTQRAAMIAELQSDLKEAHCQVDKYLSELEALKREKRSLVEDLREKDMFVKQLLEHPSISCSPIMETRSQFSSSRMSHSRNESSPVAADTVSATRLKDLEREIEKLRMDSRADMHHTHELDKSIDMLRKENAELRDKVDTKSFELKEAIANYLYIKERHDELMKREVTEEVTRSSIAPSSAVEISQMTLLETQMKDMEKLLVSTKTQLNTANTEKSRMQRLIEQLSKDLEKAKTTTTTTDVSTRSIRSDEDVPGFPPSESDYVQFVARYNKMKQENKDLKQANEKLKAKIRQLASMNVSATHWDLPVD